ncbi:MAG: hypothetical protein AAF546_02780 [Verrucomicrobiota bacterium]
MHRSTQNNGLRLNSDQTSNSYETELRKHLYVHPPASLEDASTALYFERFREIELPWAKIFENIETQTGSINALKEYFEDSWKIPLGEKQYDYKLIEPFLIELAPAGKDEKKEPGNFLYVASPDKEGTKKIETGLALKDGYGRYHLCAFMDGSTARKESFEDFDGYSKFWSHKLKSVTLCFASPEEAKTGTSKVEYVDLAEKLIHDAYDDLMSQKSFDDELQSEMDGTSQELIRRTVNSGVDLDEINRLQQTIMSVRERKFRIERRLNRLVQKAAELGYKLFLEDGEFEMPDVTKEGAMKKVPIHAGTLYEEVREVFKWTITIERVEAPIRRGWRKFTSFLGFESPEPKVFYEYRDAERKHTIYKEVEVNKDRVTDRIAELKATHEVQVFVNTDKGYYTESGRSLRDLMMRCLRDEAYRQKCAFFIPVEETSLSGRTVIAGYKIYFAPFPGIVPVDFPKLAIHEYLSYRLAWQQTQLGEVANTITLAPGESRTITVRRSFEQESTQSQKRASIFDLQESESSDITTELERELINDENSGWNLDLARNATASGKVDGVNLNASANNKFGYNKSIKKFSKSLSKSMRKASQSLNRNIKNEIVTESSQTTRISNYDEHTSTIRNINEGRTLNLVFYRLANCYQSGLYLDDLQFRVTPSVEIIAGSKIHDSVSFDTSEFGELLDEFGVSRLPFDLTDADQFRYMRKVVETLESILDTEYNNKEATEKRSAQVLSMAPAQHVFVAPKGRRAGAAAKAPLMAFGAEADAAEDQAYERYATASSKAKKAKDEEERAYLEMTQLNFENARKSLVERLESLELQGNQIESQNLQILAPGLYVDAIVGAVPSTEAYSELMREQVVEEKKATIEKLRAEAYYQRTLAHRMTDGGNRITGIMPRPERKGLTIGLQSPLPPGKWSLMVDGEKKLEIPKTQTGNFFIHLDFDQQQGWLDEADLANNRITLLDEKESLVIRQLASD